MTCSQKWTCPPNTHSFKRGVCGIKQEGIYTNVTANKMKTLEERINEVFNIAVYLQLMGAFVPNSDWRQIKEIVLSTHDFLKNSPKKQIESKLPLMRETLQKMANFFIAKFPPKKSVDEIASNWNELFKGGNNVFSYGITYGWLDEQMNIESLYSYDHVPYHFRIGLVVHKGFGEIEEAFLLKDAFNVLAKAEYYYQLLLDYGGLAKKEESGNRKEFSPDTYKQITDIKYEVAAFSRLTIISFYAFVECFVNSVGFSYLQRNIDRLNETEKETLKGLRKGRFLQLKSKIERYHKVIRDDKLPKIITSDEKQMKEPFISFFDYYEQLRNSSVHYSPLKKQIWMKPKDWLDKAREFAKLSINVSKEFWNACHENLDDPHYLGKLEFEFHINAAKERFKNLDKVEKQLIN